MGTFRLPAFMALVFGAVGLYIVWTAFEAGTDPAVGLAIAGAALVALFIFTMGAGWTRRAPEEKPVAKRVPLPADTPMPEPASSGLNFEYPDEDVTPAPTAFEPPVEFVEPEPVGQPRGTVITTDPVAAKPPRAFGQDLVEPEAPAHAPLTRKYTQDTPMMRTILGKPTLAEIPEFRAEMADPMMHPHMMPPETVRGKCGQCDALLLAPTQRPIKLTCPSCERTTLLEG